MEEKQVDKIEVSRGGYLNPEYVKQQKEKAKKILHSRWPDAEIIVEEKEECFCIIAVKRQNKRDKGEER